MIGFIKYKLFKWLWNDICEKLNCDYCPMKLEGFGICDECGNKAVDCYDAEDMMFKAARRAWEVE
jgi:hypothetical protein